MRRHRSLRCDGEPQTRVAGALRSAGEAPSQRIRQFSGVLLIDRSANRLGRWSWITQTTETSCEELLIAAMAAAFGAAVVLPAAAIVGSDCAFAAQKTAKKAKKKKPAKKYKKAA